MWKRTLLGWLAMAGVSLAADPPPPAPPDAKSAVPAATGRVAVRGDEIVDPSGRPLLLRGWNWGHWGKAQANDARDNAAQGANVVRLPLRWWGYYRGKDIDSRNDAAPGGIDPRHLAMLDNHVRWASDAGLWIVLFIDSNCGQNGTQNGEMQDYCDPKNEYRGGHNFWTDPAARAKFIAAWRFIANRYKSEPRIAMFEPLPEPNPKTASASDIRAFYAEAMAAIREVAPGIPFLVGPRGYKAAAAAEAYDPSWKDVVYTGNLFLHGHGSAAKNIGNLKERMQTLLDLRAQRRVPIFVQQVGVRSDDDPDQSQLKSVLGLLNDARLGFAYWEYRGAQNEGTYGVIYERGGSWVTKPGEMAAISAAFRR